MILAQFLMLLQLMLASFGGQLYRIVSGGMSSRVFTQKTPSARHACGGPLRMPSTEMDAIVVLMNARAGIVDATGVDICDYCYDATSVPG